MQFFLKFLQQRGIRMGYPDTYTHKKENKTSLRPVSRTGWEGWRGIKQRAAGSFFS